MQFVRFPGLLKFIYPGVVFRVAAKAKTIYLTFDDGPTPGITMQVLSMLKEFNARATFFCIGRNAERHPEIIRTILDDGHTIGNHTYSHLKGWYTPNQVYFRDIELASLYVPSALYRPAYGMITPLQTCILKKKFTIVLWDVMSYDFHPAVTPEKCLHNVIQHTRPGSVIVFHDSLKASENLLYALPKIMENFRARGYVFDCL
jgi:peptidoglycan/xylan/chitin deacetylase (PgdA/CDA1 family)